jgi:hypothetical protein
MQKKLRNCAFCERVLTTKTRTREHVWPQWLQNRLGLEKGSFEGIHSGIPWGLVTVGTRTQSVGSLVLGRICTTCNNGWMSQLETEVAPLFERLWDNANKYAVLDQQACRTIAHWTFKTSLVINLASNYRRIVPEMHFREFYKRRELPSNTVVDIALAPFKKDLRWMQGQSAIGELPESIEMTRQLAKFSRSQ